MSSFQMTLIIPSLKMLCLFNGVREEKQLQVHQIKVHLLIKSVQKTNSCLMSVCLSLSDTLCVSVSLCLPRKVTLTFLYTSFSFSLAIPLLFCTVLDLYFHEIFALLLFPRGHH